MFIISKKKLLNIKNFEEKKINNFFFYFDLIDKPIFCDDKIIIGNKYKGLLSNEDGSFLEINFKNNSLSIKRDLWGSIPVYYNENQQIVSDSLKNILNVIKKSKPNIPALAEFVCSAYNTGNRTIYSDINFLLPDETLKIDFRKNQFKILKVKLVFYIPKNLNEMVYLIESILDLSLKKFIENNSSKNLYLNLSGGTDSSLLLSKIKEQSNEIGIESLIYYHSDWRKDIVDHQYSKIASKKYNIKENLVDITNENYTTAFLKLINQTSNVMHTYAPSFFLLNKTINKSFSKILVNGSGPDESMIGSEKIKINKLIEFDKEINLNQEDFLVDKVDYLKISDKKVKKLFKEEFLNGIGNLNVRNHRVQLAKYLRRFSNKGNIAFTDLQRIFHYYTILQDHIKNIYEVSQIIGIKIFFPFLTNDFFKIIFGSKFSSLNHKSIYKYTLKKILENYFPKDFVHRKKIGFQAPSNPYFKSKKGLGEVIKKLMNTQSKIFSEEMHNHINSQIQENGDLYKRYDYTMWAFINIKLLEERGVFKI